MCKHDLEKDAILVVEGEVTIDKFSDSIRLNAQNIISLEAARKHYAKGLRITIKENQLNSKLLDDLSQLFSSSRARGLPVYIAYQHESTFVELKLAEQWYIDPQPIFLEQLNHLLSKEQVGYCY